MNNNHYKPATAPEHPIYKGDSISALAQQLSDIREVAKNGMQTKAFAAAKLRLEMTQNRNMSIVDAQVRYDNRTAGTGGLTAGTLSEGGFFLQAETSADLLAAGYNNSEVLKRCGSRSLSPGAQKTDIILTDETSRATGARHGGIRVYTTAELDQFTASRPKLRIASMEPKKLTALYYASDEITDARFLAAELRKAFAQEYAFVCQDQIINGSGVNEALGVLNASCLVTVSKESGQPAKTINTKNISKMWACYHGSAQNAVWLINRNVSAQLDELVVNDGAAASCVIYGPGGMFIKGAPVFEIEQCSTLGTVGDIMLCDFSQYVTADRGLPIHSASIHVNFIYAQNAFRFTFYFDGQPRYATPISPYKGEPGAVVSPFVALETRS